MSLTSILWIAISAVLDVCAHAAMKRARNRMAFIWWMWFWVALFSLPVLLLAPRQIPGSAWALMAVTAIVNALYYRSLAKAYQTADLSIVYPIARGTAPIFILGWSALWLQERPSVGGIIGIGVIVTGLVALNLPRFSAWRDLGRSFATPASRWALAAGLCTSLYTTVDKVGVRFVTPLLYSYLTMTMMVIYLTPGMLRRIGWRGLKDELNASRFSSIFAGTLAMAAYAIVLVIMQQGLPASYAGATREISVVFGTVIGMVLLNEQATIMRVLGLALIAVGTSVVALLG